MGARIRLITVVVVAAMTVGVPVAFGEGRPAGSHEEVQQSAPSLAAYEEAVATGQLDLSTFRNAFDRATPVAGLGSNMATYRDAFERAVFRNALDRATPVAGLGSNMATYRDAFERAVTVGQLDLSTFRNAFDRAGGQSQGLQSRAGTYRDAHERGIPVAIAVKAPTTEVGANIEWPQIGIGFGVGILLAIGLLLAVRTMRVRPLAH